MCVIYLSKTSCIYYHTTLPWNILTGLVFNEKFAKNTDRSQTLFSCVWMQNTDRSQTLFI